MEIVDERALWERFVAPRSLQGGRWSNPRCGTCATPASMRLHALSDHSSREDPPRGQRESGSWSRTSRSVETSIIDQVAGRSPLVETLRASLLDPSFETFCFAVAFVRWSGLYMLDESLQSFARRGRIDGIVGVDLGGTTADALHYLSSLPGTRLRICNVANPYITFHPKYYIFRGPGAWRAIIGSANLTLGGTFDNMEVSVCIDGRADEVNPVWAPWRRLSRGAAPLAKENLIVVEPGSIPNFVLPVLDPPAVRAPDRPAVGRALGPNITPLTRPPQLPRPPLVGPSHRRSASRSRSAAPTASQRQPITAGTGPLPALYLTVGRETGGGTQLQIPKPVYEDYFGVTPGTYAYAHFYTPAGTIVRQLSAFATSGTYRVRLPFLADVPRPAVARFMRTAQDEYQVDARAQGKRGYASWLRKCVEQSRSGAKRYGIHPQ